MVGVVLAPVLAPALVRVRVRDLALVDLLPIQDLAPDQEVEAEVEAEVVAVHQAREGHMRLALLAAPRVCGTASMARRISNAPAEPGRLLWPWLLAQNAPQDSRRQSTSWRRAGGGSAVSCSEDNEMPTSYDKAGGGSVIFYIFSSVCFASDVPQTLGAASRASRL